MTSHQLATEIVKWIGVPELFNADGSPVAKVVEHIDDMIFEYVSEELDIAAREADERIT